MAEKECAKCGTTRPVANAVCELDPMPGFKAPCAYLFDRGIIDVADGQGGATTVKRPRKRTKN